MATTSPAAVPAIYKLTPDEQKREAVGKLLSIVASVVGLVGTGLVLSINPQVKAQANAAFRRLPAPMQQNKTFTLLIGAVGAAALLAWVINNKMKSAS